MKFFKLIILFLSFQTYVLEKNEIESKLNSIVPKDIKVLKVEDTISPNFFLVQLTDGSLFYVTVDGEFIINGDLYQIAKNSLVNLSDLRNSKERIKKLSQINKNEFISFTPVKMETEIYVFTDVDCGYCRKLHSEIENYLKEGIQVNYLAYPREGLESKTYKKMQYAWCSDEPQRSLTSLKSGKNIEKVECQETIVSKHYNLAKEFNARGTPTIILENGDLLAGYHSAKEILDLLKN